jgi:hypothetical protein
MYTLSDAITAHNELTPRNTLSSLLFYNGKEHMQHTHGDL